MHYINPKINQFHTTDPFLSIFPSFGASVQDIFSTTTTQKIKDAVTSPVGQVLIGFGLGLGLNRITVSLTEKIFKFSGVSTGLTDPFNDESLSDKILSIPSICILSPILEEIIFRGYLQGMLKDKFESFYVNRDFPDSRASNAARVTSVFFTSVIFGLLHFINAISFSCNPILFLPQVVNATIWGFIFGFGKELSGGLYIPLGMHIGNNTLGQAILIIDGLSIPKCTT